MKQNIVYKIPIKKNKESISFCLSNDICQRIGIKPSQKYLYLNFFGGSFSLTEEITSIFLPPLILSKDNFLKNKLGKK